MEHSDIGTRMKAYENCYRVYLPRRQAVIVRIDGRAFHTFTKGFVKPYDEFFAEAMQETTKQLCENIGGCKFGYTQSDEISLVLTDYETINTEPWFGNNLQKIVSISASMATFFFRQNFLAAVVSSKEESNNPAYFKAYGQKLCVFDSRAFIIPREEVVNYFYWRQLDCVRNSIQSAGQANFSHKDLQGLNCDQIQEKLFQEKNINWSKDYPAWFRNGAAFYKKPINIITPNEEVITRNKWYIDLDIPMFSAQPDFINKHIIFNKE